MLENLDWLHCSYAWTSDAQVRWGCLLGQYRNWPEYKITGGKAGRRSSSLHDCDCVKSKCALIKGIVIAVKSLFHPNGSSIVLEWKWLLIYIGILSLDFLPLGFPLPYSSMYFNFISLLVMQHKISLINGLQCFERLWNFDTPEVFWLVGWMIG